MTPNKLFICSLLFAFSFVCSTFGWNTYVTLEDLAKLFHLQFKQEKDKIHLYDSKNHWIFQENSKEIFLNTIKIFLTYPVQTKLIGKKNPKKISSIHSIDKEKLIAILQQPKTFAIKTIVLDPGHGGKSEGAINKNLNLKDIVICLFFY